MKEMPELPELVYLDPEGTPKEPVSIRLPKTLKEKLEALAATRGGFAKFVQVGLDQWAGLHDMPDIRRKK